MAKRKRHSSRDAPQFWPVAYIKDEDKATGRYLVVWEGPYDPTWEPREFVNQPAIDEWERRHASPLGAGERADAKSQHTASIHRAVKYAPPVHELPAIASVNDDSYNMNQYAVQRPQALPPRETPGAESVTTNASGSAPVSPMMRNEMIRRVSFTDSQVSADGAPPVKRPVIRRPPPQRGHTPVRIIKTVGWR